MIYTILGPPMKKPKIVKPFFFKNHTHQQIVDLLNLEDPISLKYNEDLINRVHARYSIIDKPQISIIVKSIFQSLRDFLVLGKVLNFNNVFFDTKLLMFPHLKKGVTFPAVKVQISTPPPLRNNK